MRQVGCSLREWRLDDWDEVWCVAIVPTGYEYRTIYDYGTAIHSIMLSREHNYQFARVRTGGIEPIVKSIPQLTDLGFLTKLRPSQRTGVGKAIDPKGQSILKPKVLFFCPSVTCLQSLSIHQITNWPQVYKLQGQPWHRVDQRILIELSAALIWAINWDMFLRERGVGAVTPPQQMEDAQGNP